MIKPVTVGMGMSNLPSLEKLKIESTMMRRIYGPRVLLGSCILRASKEIEELETVIRKRRLRIYVWKESIEDEYKNFGQNMLTSRVTDENTPS